jgi:hypothetical protein
LGKRTTANKSFDKFKLIGITPDRGANSKEMSASLSLSASPWLTNEKTQGGKKKTKGERNLRTSS